MATKNFDYLIIGAGLYDSVFAHEAYVRGKSCLVIDRRNHTGGNIFCENIEGINVQKYGAHIFLKISPLINNINFERKRKILQVSLTKLMMS